MKRPLFKVLGHMVLEQMRNIGILNGVLSRKLDEEGLEILSTTIHDALRGDVLRVVKGDTDRIRTLRDVAKLIGKRHVEEDVAKTQLHFCKVLTETSFPEPGERLSRVWRLEFIRALMLSNPSAARTCDDFEQLRDDHNLLFHVYDFSHLMLQLDERQYVRLECSIRVRTGDMQIRRFICASEEIDEATDNIDPVVKVWFDTDKIFTEVFEDLYNFWFCGSEIDLGSYHKDFMASNEVQDSRTLTIYTGVPGEDGKYATEYFQFNRSEEGQNWLVQVEAPGAFPLRRSVQEHEVIPYMVACLALSMPDEKDFLVQYDPEERSLVIIPGDPYVGTDTLAEVLPESGLGISDGTQS